MKRQYLSAIQLIDESTHLLRQLPLSAYFIYYLGSIPFILGMVFFWTEMILSSVAIQQLILRSFLLSVLFIWMKCCQSLFAGQVFEYLLREPHSKVSLRQLLGMACVHATYQPWGFLTLPIGAVLTIPFGWLFAYHQNLTVLASLKGHEQEDLSRVARQQAALQWKQNHGIIGILSLFSVFVFLNIMLGGLFIPQLLKMILGVETVFSKAGTHLLNSSFLWACAGVTYLCVDPMIKTTYLLRCFYGQARKNGQDLKMEIQRFKGLSKAGVVCLLVILPFQLKATIHGTKVGGSPYSNQEKMEYKGHSEEKNRFAIETGNPNPGKHFSEMELNQNIEKVLSKTEYEWRRPRIANDDLNQTDGFLQSMIEAFRDAMRSFSKWFMDLFRKLFDSKEQNMERPPSMNWFSSNQLATALLVLVVILLIILVVLLLKNRKESKADLELEPAADSIDLRQEDMIATSLPDDEWFQMGHSLLEKGDFRLAIRAYFLSTLSLLGQKEILHIASFKSNAEYRRELNQRAQSYPLLPEPFQANIALYEQVWFGLYQVTETMVESFLENHSRIKANVDL